MPPDNRDESVFSSHEWGRVLRAGVKAQRLVLGCVAVGGTAAALYARHRVSQDTNHLLSDLSDRFDEIRESLEASPGWKTARVNVRQVILGSIDGVPVGYRQMLRSLPLTTASVATPEGHLVVPSLDELMGMKAYLAYSRGATRDFLDFAALASLVDDDSVVAALLRSNDRYGALQTDSVALEIAKVLAEPQPYDLDSIDLGAYKRIQPPWHNWSITEAACAKFGILLAERLLNN